MSKKLVSIIMPTFNSNEFVIESIRSVQYQTYPYWELLITDDNSTDNTREIIREICQSDNRIKLFSHSVNCGTAVARNNSLKHVQGEFIAFLDSDDIWLPKKLSTQLKFMNSEIDFSFTAFEIIDQYGQSKNKVVDSKQLGKLSYHDMLRKKATMGCSTVMLRRSTFPDLQMPLLRTGQDYALWLSLLKKGHFAFPLNQALTKYRISPNSISRNKIKKALRQWSIYRKTEQLSLYHSSVSFIFYAWRAVFRK